MQKSLNYLAKFAIHHTRPRILSTYSIHHSTGKSVAQNQYHKGENITSANCAEASISHAETLLRDSYSRSPSADEKRLGALSRNESATAFAMRYIDRVERVRGAKGSAEQLLTAVKDSREGTSFLGPLDKTILALGVMVLELAPWLAPIVMTGAKMRMRDVVGKLVLVDGKGLDEGVGTLQQKGFGVNVNLLGELVLGDEEAKKRLDQTIALMKNENIDYVSVKVSGVTARLNYWDADGSLARIEKNFERVFRASKEASTFVNVDMEAYEEIALSYDAFMSILGREEFASLDAGIVLQAYLPDAVEILERLVAWSNERCRRGGGKIKVRIVKGANLAQEKVDAEMKGWEQAPYLTKEETDANWLRCMDFMLSNEHPERTESITVGIATHNMFSASYAYLLAAERSLLDRVQFEMISGMVPAQASAVRNLSNSRLLLYTPVCEEQSFLHAVSYLFRRLEENGSGDNYLRSLMSTDEMLPGSEAFEVEANRFKAAIKRKDAYEGLKTGTRRVQERPASEAYGYQRARDALVTGSYTFFVSEPDTDPSLPANRVWAQSLCKKSHFTPAKIENTSTLEGVQSILDASKHVQKTWSGVDAKTRAEVLLSIGNEMARRRGDLINALIVEGNKILAEADVEVSEAIDFAMYYAERTLHLPPTFNPLGSVVVASPWNYPVAIAVGGVLASLATGNSAILKSAPETVRCGEILAECITASDLPQNVFQFVKVPENECGRHLITQADAVILTGASETASLFRSWKPEMKLFAETSGKNCMVVTPSCDMDLAVSDLVESAFGHTGQKCSASSLCILVGDMGRDENFLRQLKDAVESLEVVTGSAMNISSEMPPLIAPPSVNLRRALTTLDDGEEWLVEPRCLDREDGERTWTPGVKLQAGEWFRSTECFGGVLGIVKAADLDEALRIQNSGAFGLTAGIQSLDTAEIEHWSNSVEAGNLYINRGTSGAIVRRQPFGGIKKSSCGPGAMAGGPNYIQQLGTHKEECVADIGEWLEKAKQSDMEAWESTFSKEIDWANLAAESNIHRYRPARVAIRIGTDAPDHEIERVKASLYSCEISENDVKWSYAENESDNEFASRLPDLHVARVRVIGNSDGESWKVVAAENNVHIADNDVVCDGRVESLNYLQEQCISRTRHRFGNLLLEKVAAKVLPSGHE